MNYYNKIVNLTTHQNHYGEDVRLERAFQQGFKHGRYQAANDDGDDRYNYETVPSVLACNSLPEAEAICKQISAEIVREIKI